MKYKLYYIECHNPYNHLNEEIIPETDQTREIDKEGIENIIKEYEAMGAKAKCIGIDSGDWGEFEITHEFEANNIEEAKKIAGDLYDGSADIFNVYDETGKRVLTEEGID